MAFYETYDYDYNFYWESDSDSDCFHVYDDYDYLPSTFSVEPEGKANKFMLKGSGRKFLNDVCEMVQEEPQSKDFQLEFQDKREMRINSMILTNMSSYFSVGSHNAHQ